MSTLHKPSYRSYSAKQLVPPGSTIAPVIIATDKTQLAQFGSGRKAYPVYLTLGNISRRIRRKPSQHACILLGYLPSISVADTNLTDAEQRSRNARLFHEAMRIILQPLTTAAKIGGVPIVCADRNLRNVIPLLAVYAADYPEQCLVSCTKYGTCPRCKVSAEFLDDMNHSNDRIQSETAKTIEDLRVQSKTNQQFYQACLQNDLSPGVSNPFWKDMPYTDIHLSMASDVLHQLYQGVLKHLIAWVQKVMNKTELDRRIQCLPPSYGVRHFKKGFSVLAQVSGPERKNMAKILLGCLVGSNIAGKGIKACKALLDFIYLAQYTSHDNDTLSYMENALKEWEENRDYFIEADVRPHFKIPKFHSLLHYIQCIKYFGTTDNYNTEFFERLHIDFAKKGWRASNKKNEAPQMIRWLSRQEKVASFERHLEPPQDVGEKIQKNLPDIMIPKRAVSYNRPIALIAKEHSCPMLNTALINYLAEGANMSLKDIKRHGNLHQTYFNSLHVYRQCKLKQLALQDDEEEVVYTIKAHPDTQYDTVVVISGNDAEATGLQGM